MKMKAIIFLLFIFLLFFGINISYANTGYNLEFHILDGDVFEPDDLANFSLQVRNFLDIDQLDFEKYTAKSYLLLDTKKPLSIKDVASFDDFLILQKYDTSENSIIKELLKKYDSDSRLLYLLTTTEENKAIWNDLPYGTVYSLIINSYDTPDGIFVEYLNIEISKYESNEEYYSNVESNSYQDSGITDREKEKNLESIFKSLDREVEKEESFGIDSENVHDEAELFPVHRKPQADFKIESNIKEENSFSVRDSVNKNVTKENEIDKENTDSTIKKENNYILSFILNILILSVFIALIYFKFLKGRF